MTRRSWVQMPDGTLVEKEKYQDNQPSAGFFVVGDIQPYKSMVTGEMIGGRRQHREHLRQHNCVEVGNSFDKAQQRSVAPPDGLKQRLIEVFNSRT